MMNFLLNPFSKKKKSEPKAAIYPVGTFWGGIYDGRRVNVHINRVEPTSRIPHIRVLISDVHTKLNYSMANKNLNSIWLLLYNTIGIMHLLL